MQEKNFDNLYGETRNMSLEEQIVLERNKTYELRKQRDLQENADTFSKEDYELILDAIENNEFHIEVLQAQLKEELKEKIKNGLHIEGDLDSIVKNPYREENFEIEKSMSGSYLVRSDSKKLGERAIVYEDPNRNNCVNYIEERQPAKQPTYYVSMKEQNENTRGTLEECLKQYREYVANVSLEGNIYKDHVTCTLGVATDKNDMDLIYCVNGISYAGTDIIKNQEHNTNKHILNDLGAVVDILNIKQAAILEENGIDYVFLEQLDGKEIYEASSKERKEQLQDVFINGILLPKTGYEGAPEVTQELFDKILQNGTKDLNFDGCYFSEVTISGKFENVSFENCNMFGGKFENVEFVNSNFDNVWISDTNLKNVTFSTASFVNARLNNSQWETTKFQDTDFLNSTWKHIATVKDTVSFEECNFLLTDMNSVYIKGSHATNVRNVDGIHVMMGGATREEIENHKKSIMDTLKPNKAITVEREKIQLEIDAVKPKRPKKEKSR